MDTTSATVSAHRYIPALDGLRGLAVWMVVAFHLAASASGGGLATAVRFGWAGVDLFFVLSGFLITGILFDQAQKARPGAFLRAFYARRVLRLAPLFYAVLAAYALAAPWLAQGPAIADALPWHATYITNVRVTLAGTWAAAPGYTSHLWSLALEEQFYLVWPAVVLAVLRWAQAPRVTLMWICGLLVGVALAVRIWTVPFSPMGAYVLLPARMDALAVGGWLAMAQRGPGGRALVQTVGRWGMAVGAVGLVPVALASAGPMSYFHPAMQTAGYTLWAVLWGGVLVYAVQPGRLAHVLEWRPLLWSGRVSYGLYLLHYPVMFALDAAGVREAGVAVFATATVVVSVAAAALSWRLIEAPALSLKRRFPYPTRAVAPTPREQPDSGVARRVPHAEPPHRPVLDPVPGH